MNPITVKQNYVTFLSPGSFLPEERTRTIGTWNVNEATKLAEDVEEHYGATPHSFYFSTRGRGNQDMDSRELSRSGMYYLHAKIESLQEIRERDDPADKILIKNMEGNEWDRVVVNKKGHRWVQPLMEGDVVLEYDPAQ